MSLSQIMFSLNGRIGRGAYFGYSLLVMVFAFLMAAAGGAAMATNTTLGFGLIIGALVILFWPVLALLVKRLHDLDMSGLHVIWIYGLGVVSNVVATQNAALSIVFGLASLGVALWLLFAPGQLTDNRFGPSPKARMVPATTATAV